MEEVFYGRGLRFECTRCSRCCRHNPGYVFLSPVDLARLAEAQIIWLASIRPNSSPHLVPIWFVTNAHRIYICTSVRSVKARNIVRNPHVTIALEDGTNPLVIEGAARRVREIPDAVIEAFRQKYDWDIRKGGTYDAVIEIIPERILLG